MSSYAQEHADAYADILDAGTSVTFARDNPGTYDPITDTFTDVPDTSIACAAMAVKGNPDQYVPGSLNMATMPTLFVSPATYPLKAHTPQFVMPGDKVAWNAVDFVAKAIYPLAVNGDVITARIVVAA